ncbi:mycofactocin biosynthesis glycosyltransferase MftF [Haloarculaceae archaeon H-GB1-1]|nr:mycofactocin biosynthesis glycosyltransferase MftF [Haloarculaceae archaeon H-GB1-1]
MTVQTPGRYRIREAVRRRDRLVVCPRPLAATRLNETATRLLDALCSDTFRSVSDAATEAGVAIEHAASLFAQLQSRGFLEWRPERDPDHRPPVSVVVTVRNEADAIGACLDALAALDYPTFEVVVVDDGSTDGTRDAVRSHPLCESGVARIVAVGSASDPLGIGASRNRGVEAARHDVVAFTDADCRPRPAWLADLVPCLAAHDVVGGRIRPAGDRALDTFEGTHSSLDMGPRAARVDRESATPYLATANLVGRRTVFEAIPFPDRSVAEDVDVCWRAIDAGYDVVYVPEGVVEHDYGGNPEFLRRRVSYGGSEALLAREYGHPSTVAVPVVALVGVLALALLGTLQRAPTVEGLDVVAVLSVGLTVGPASELVAARRAFAPAKLVAALGRSALSRSYALAAELGRYYALVGAVAAALAGLVGFGTLAGPLLFVVGWCLLFPAVVDYLLHRPRVDPLRYAWWYVLDALAYQVGAYRGAVTHRTVAHLAPRTRFALAL